jgi:hypothetical protein
MRSSVRSVRGTTAFVAGLAATAVALVGVAPATAMAAEQHTAKKTYASIVVDPDLYALMGLFGIEIHATGKAKTQMRDGTIEVLLPIKSIKKHGKIVKTTGGFEFGTATQTLTTNKYVFSLKKKKMNATALLSGSAVGDLGKQPVFTMADTTRADLGDYNLLITQEAADAFNTTFPPGGVTAGTLIGYGTPTP